MHVPCGSDGKASVYNAGDLDSIPGSGKIPWGRKQQPTPVLLPRKSHGQRSLVQATAHGVAKSWIGLSDFTFTFSVSRQFCLLYDFVGNASNISSFKKMFAIGFW